MEQEDDYGVAEELQDESPSAHSPDSIRRFRELASQQQIFVDRSAPLGIGQINSNSDLDGLDRVVRDDIQEDEGQRGRQPMGRSEREVLYAEGTGTFGSR